MFFDTLLTVANRAIKDLSLSRPASSEPKLWISPLMHTRSQSSPSTYGSSNSPPASCPLNFSQDLVEKGELEVVDTKKPCFSSRSRRSTFSGKRYALQPKTLGTTSEDEDSHKSVPLHHPHPKHPAPAYNPSGMWSFRDDTVCPPEEDTPPSSPSPSPSPDNGSCSSSLVPTVVGTRSPSPQPHPCVDQARALGIKVRDFAHEDHGVTVAPFIPDIDQLKISYYLYRSAGLTPPFEAMENLKIYEPEWFIDAERRFETQSHSKAKSGTPIRTWEHETEQGHEIEQEETVLEEAVEDEPLVGKITPWLETIDLQNVSQDAKDIHP